MKGDYNRGDSELEKTMKSYVLVTAVIFGLITALHIWRAVVEAPHFEFGMALLTLISAGLCIWAVTLLQRLRRS